MGLEQQQDWKSRHGSVGRWLFLWIKSQMWSSYEYNWAEMGEPAQSLHNQLSTCSQQLREIASMQEKSYLKVNQVVTGDKGAHLSVCLSSFHGHPTVYPLHTKPATRKRKICLPLVRPFIILECVSPFAPIITFFSSRYIIWVIFQAKIAGLSSSSVSRIYYFLCVISL